MGYGTDPLRSSSSRLFLRCFKQLCPYLSLSISYLEFSFCTYFLQFETDQRNSVTQLFGVIYQWHHEKMVFLTDQNSTDFTGRRNHNCKALIHYSA